MKRPLDRIDRALLLALQNDARLSNKELAAHVGLAPSSCLERVRALRTAGVLRGFHADVDPEALGIGLRAVIAVRMRRQSRDLDETFRRNTAKRPEVMAVQHIAGDNDYLVHVAVADVEHLRNFTMDELTAHEEVAHVETTLVFDHHVSWTLPDYSEGAETARSRNATSASATKTASRGSASSR